MSEFGRCGGGGRRRAAREPAPLVAVLTTVTRANRATIIDISTKGVRLRGPYPPGCGEEIMVSIEALRVFGHVAWCRGDDFGVEFDDPLDEDDVGVIRDKAGETLGLGADMKLALDIWMGGAPR
jgi:hypothetical protein